MIESMSLCVSTSAGSGVNTAHVLARSLCIVIVHDQDLDKTGTRPGQDLGPARIMASATRSFCPASEMKIETRSPGKDDLNVCLGDNSARVTALTVLFGVSDFT